MEDRDQCSGGGQLRVIDNRPVGTGAEWRDAEAPVIAVLVGPTNDNKRRRQSSWARA